MLVTWWWYSITLITCISVPLSECQVTRSCPHQELILPCRCLVKGEETQIWCSHSDLPRVIGGLRAVGQYIFYPIDELILENNNLPSLPGRSFLPLKVMRLMLRYNGLKRVSNGWLNGLEQSLMELFIVEPELRSLPEESLEHLENLEAVTIQSNSIKHLPNFSRLPSLRYIQIESFSLTELSPLHYKHLPVLEKIQISNSIGLGRLEAGLLQDLPRLKLVNISFCGVSWLHPRSIARLPILTDLSLIGNKISDVGMIGRGIRDLPRLETVNLDYNDIENIQEAAFVDLPSLKKLTLSNNQIAELHHGAFHRVPKLKTVDLSNNLVRRVHPESFLLHSSSGLEELWLMNNDISHVAELRSLLDSLPRLIFLEMSYNNLEAIPFGALRGHPTLERLHLDHNKLHLIDREAFMAMPALRELRLKNNSLSDTLDGPLWNLPALKGLDLSKNYFRRIGPRLFENIPSLRKVDLHGNDLIMVDPATFLATPALEHVNLSQNALATLHPATFRHLLNLFELDVSYNRLVEFVPGLPRGIEYLYMSHNKITNMPLQPSPDTDLPSLRLLDLSANIIEKLPSGAFHTLPQLKKLFLGGNSLQQLNEKSFHGLAHLEVLGLKFNRIQQIHPRAFREVTELYDLNLRENHIDTLRPEIFETNTHLKRIDVSQNQLSEILPGTLENFRDVQVLDASNNLLVELPQSIFGLKNLHVLNLSNNLLKSVHPQTLSSLSSLMELRISNNKVRELKTESFNKLLEVKILDLNSNEIYHMESNSINSLPLLQSINLSKNKLTNIPNAAFSDLPSLQVAELQENQLKNVANNAFEGVPHLLMLNLSYNQLSDIEEAGLKSLTSLEMLDISNNKLSRVSTGTLEEMEWLVELRMDNNHICSIHGSTFNGMPRLRVLSVTNNKMTTFPESAIQKLRGNIAIFDLDGNPLICSCSMLWMRGWLQESSLIGPRCADGTLLREMRLSRQECLEEEKIIESVAPGCEAELLSTPPDVHHTSQMFSKWMNLKVNSTKHLIGNKNNLAPTPEESEYFYDEYVDYPYNETGLMDPLNTITNTNIKEHKININSTTILPPLQTPQTLHYVTGNTPTLYAGTARNKSKLQPPKGISGSPSSSGFTFFGVPLPSLSFNGLWGRMAEKKTGHTAIAQRKTAIVNKPYSDFEHTVMMPPSLPEIQRGGFVPLLPGTTGGFKPIITTKSSVFQKPHIFALNEEKVKVKHSTGAADATNLSPTIVPASANYFNLQNKISSIGHHIPIPTDSTLKLQERRSTTTESTYGSSKIQTKIEILKPNVSITTSTPKIDHLVLNATEVANITSSKPNNKPELPINPKIISTKKTTPRPSYPELEIASDAQSFSEIFMDIVGNVTLITTKAPMPLETTTSKITTLKTTTPPSKVQDTVVPYPANIESKGQSTLARNEEPTSLSALLIPGGLQPQYRLGGGKSSISKVPSPHVSATAPLQADLDLDFADQLAPLAHNREGKTTFSDPTKQNDDKNDATERSWYFMNYNKTNLEPFIGPGNFKYGSNSANVRNVYVVLLFTYSFIVNLF